MERSKKDAWLSGKGDLKEADVTDVPVKGQSVRVRGLPAAYSNQAQSEALEMKTIGREQIATVNTARLEILQFAHGVIEPEFSVEEAEAVAQRFGPAFRKVIAKIDELSGIDKEAIDEANARFRSSETGSGDDGPAGADEAPAGGS
jgi:hypothetical protein